VFETSVRDFQTNVVDTGPGALRGYLANIDRVRSRGAEFDSEVLLNEHLSAHLSATWTDARYVSYKNGPCPLELIGNSTTICDLSGKGLPAVPNWVWSAGGEYRRPVTVDGVSGDAYGHVEMTARTRIFGDQTDSRYTVIDGYTLVNASIGLRARRGWEVSVWAKNLFEQNYLQNVTVQAGNSGLVIGTPSDPRTVGVTFRTRY